jgi:hypothetical protein
VTHGLPERPAGHRERNERDDHGPDRDQHRTQANDPGVEQGLLERLAFFVFSP